jgi:hypothetical protein
MAPSTGITRELSKMLKISNLWLRTNGALTLLSGYIAGKPVTIMIDSGATACFIDEQFVNSECIEQIAKVTPHVVRLADGSQQIHGTCKHPYGWLQGR